MRETFRVGDVVQIDFTGKPLRGTIISFVKHLDTTDASGPRLMMGDPVVEFDEGFMTGDGRIVTAASVAAYALHRIPLLDALAHVAEEA